jgi:hypothetical protein
MNLMKWQTQPRPVAPQPSPRPCYKVYMFLLIQTPKGWIQVHMFTNSISVSFWLLYTISYSSNHESNERTDPTKTSSIPTKRSRCYKVYMLFLIYTPKGWIQVHMFTNPISVSFWLLHTISYSSNHESNERTDPTKTSSTPTKHSPSYKVYMLFLIYTSNRPKVDLVIHVYVCHRFEVLSPLSSLRFT